MQTLNIAGYRLSPPQRHLWLLQQTDPLSPYRSVCVISVCGPLDLLSLRQAFRLLVSRHEILRTTYRRIAGLNEPLQIVNEEMQVDMEEVNAEGRGEEERREEVKDRALWKTPKNGTKSLSKTYLCMSSSIWA